MIMVSSDATAFMRPLYRRLADNRTFHLLAESMQFELLIAAVAELSASHAADARLQRNDPTCDPSRLMKNGR